MGLIKHGLFSVVEIRLLKQIVSLTEMYVQGCTWLNTVLKNTGFLDKVWNFLMI